jgi:hypothetical protein
MLAFAYCLSRCEYTSDFLAFTKYTAGSPLPVWRKPRNEPLVEVDRAVLVAVHHQTTVLMLAAIRSFPQWHILLMLAGMTHPGCIALIYDIQCFPKAQTLVREHLHKAVESPIIIHQAVAYLSLAPFFGGLLFFLFDDPSASGKDHRSPQPFPPVGVR